MFNDYAEKLNKPEQIKRTRRNTLSQPSFVQNVNIIFESSEYWKYLYGGSSNLSPKDGLLPVLVESIEEIKKRGWHENEITSNIFMKIKDLLIKMKENLYFLENFIDAEVNNIIFYIFLFFS